MADNYLESKMEEHRRSAVRPTVSRAARTAPSVSLRLAYRHILVDGIDHEAAPAIMSRLSATGATVSFFEADSARGTRLAQSTGARYIPLTGSLDDAIATATAGRGPIETVIRCGDLGDDAFRLVGLTDARDLIVVGNADLNGLDESLRVNAINPMGIAAADVASLALWLLTRAAAFLNRRTLP